MSFKDMFTKKDASQSDKDSENVEEIKLDIKKKDKKDNNILPTDDYFPLQGETAQDAEVKPDASQTSPIDEPPFQKPDWNTIGQQQEAEKVREATRTGATTQAGTQPPSSGPAPSEPPAIPGMDSIKNMPPEQKQIAAEQLVDLGLKGYAKAKGVANWVVKVSDDEQMELISEDKIDPNLVIPLSQDGQSHCTISEFIRDYNNQADETFQVKQSFINAVRPPAIRVCVKNNWGMSDEVYLAWMFGEDISTTIAGIYGFKKTMNRCLEAFKKVHADNKKENKENVGGTGEYEQVETEDFDDDDEDLGGEEGREFKEKTDKETTVQDETKHGPTT